MLKRSLTLWDLVLYGVVLIQPVAPMGIFGAVSMEARGHVVTTILIGMCAMLCTAVSYGRLAAIYPSAGSAFTYVARELNVGLGCATGWCMVLDYILNPVICTILCSKLMMNYVPGVPYSVFAIGFAATFTWLNLRGVKQTARVNAVLALIMGIVVVVFLGFAATYLLRVSPAPAAWVRPFYDPATFSLSTVATGASIAALTYIGFDGISTLSEEVENPRRNVMLATVYTCLAIGLLASIEVYAAQMVWGRWDGFPDVDTAFVHVARKAGGPLLFAIMNATLLVANAGSGIGAQTGAARLMLGMGRSGILPAAFAATDETRGVPRNNVLLVGVVSLAGALTLSYEQGAELVNFGAFVAFCGVNLAALLRHRSEGSGKLRAGAIPPALGLAFCAYLFFSLQRAALLVGSSWLLVGIVYAAVRTSGFRRALGSFDAPAD